MRALWLPSVLRTAGLNVVTVPGWEQRGSELGDLRAVVWHHDGSPPGASPGVPAYMAGQIDLGKPGAQCWVALDGTWHVVASGKVSHTGEVRSGKPGNSRALGVETDKTTGEAWPAQQLDSLRRGTAAILRKLGENVDRLEFHKTICSPPGRKTDPDGLDLDVERRAVAALLTPIPRPPITTSTTEYPEDAMQRIDTQIDLDRDGHGYRDLPVDPMSVVNVVFNTQNPATKGYQPAPDWHRLNIDGHARIVVEEGLPGGRVDCSVWVA